MEEVHGDGDSSSYHDDDVVVGRNYAVAVVNGVGHDENNVALELQLN